MKIEGRHTFSKGREEVWKSIQDPQTLAATLPGVRRLEVVGPDRYALTADVGVGSVKGLFDGTFAVEDKKDFESCILTGTARGASGSADVRAHVRLSDDDGSGSTLDYEAEAKIGGPIAAVGQRMILAASRRMAEQFFDALDRYDESTPAPARRPVQEGSGTSEQRVFESPPPAPDATRSLVAGMLMGFALAMIGVGVGRWSARR